MNPICPKCKKTLDDKHKNCGVRAAELEQAGILCTFIFDTQRLRAFMRRNKLGLTP